MRIHLKHKSRRCGYGAILCLIIALMLEILAVNFLMAIEDKNGLYYMNPQEGSGISMEEASLFYNRELGDGTENFYEILFYHDAGLLAAEGEGTRRSVDTRVIYTYGRSDLLISDTLRLEADDKGFCLLGEETAFTLFGTVRAEGLKVRAENSVYTVAGVTKEMKNVLIAPAWQRQEVLFDRITVSPYDQKERIIIQQEIESTLDAGIRMENDFIRWLLELLIITAPTLWLIFIAKMMIQRKGWSKEKDVALMGERQERNVKWKRRSVICTAWILVLMLFYFTVHYPQDLIPPAWSDFDFWGDILKEKGTSVEIFLLNTWTEQDFRYVLHTAAAVLCSVGAICFSLFAMMVKRERVPDRRLKCIKS